MKFVKLEVSNYRNFENIVLDLSNKNVIFGLNDIGKSNLLSVFRLLFDRKYRSNNCIESDYHNKNTEKDIEILLEIELKKDEPTVDDEMCTYLDTDNPVDYLQDKKMINMIELIKKLTKEDCEKIYNSEQFYCIRDWNEKNETSNV